MQSLFFQAYSIFRVKGQHRFTAINFVSGVCVQINCLGEMSCGRLTCKTDCYLQISL